ncbi:purine-nucleoside phosphorylase [Candidatus Roizmanbacteria bacterium CG10_big_fil_rev_8_21_14_0_10_39_6]|uniref:purine-nucleoside phosphorylase n=1 Tax=Candidatus Roizmanbacteria bacterium CG10_big_fil_rev_8_21_14_0_10_39_6 TaxID=1974853 RepID=A0A2M8KST7_9BACT|nr:MAG: purine-nucleoside phosphorylase [Candidatus Roizmanbacteria bacterium CG10_big_fil_rev_8_21_14_0_10_39_6]
MFTLEKSFAILKKAIPHFPDTVLMLGSGWNLILERKERMYDMSYSDLFGVTSTVPGHEGHLVVVDIGGRKVACMSGRFHTYEGHSGSDATLPIKLFQKASAKTLIVTSASGALNEKYAVGDIIILSDLLTLFLGGYNPLVGANFVDMSSVFDAELATKAKAICVKNKFSFHEGVYSYVRGPHYETPADKIALRFLGADVVGMSTVPEVLMAKSLNMRVLGLSFVTNLAFVKHDHKEVLFQATKASSRMKLLLEGVLQK